MYYYCYISGSKVGQYTAQLVSGGAAPQLPDSTRIIEGASRSAGLQGGLKGFLSLLSVSAKFGSSEKTEAHSDRRTHLVERLLHLTSQLHARDMIRPLSAALERSEGIQGEFFYVQAPMTVVSYDTSTTLISFCLASCQVELACSTRNFSEYTDFGEDLMRLENLPLTSGNYHFFKGLTSPVCDALVIPVGRPRDSGSRMMYATPLFIALDQSSGLAI